MRKSVLFFGDEGRHPELDPQDDCSQDPGLTPFEVIADDVSVTEYSGYYPDREIQDQQRQCPDE